MGLLASIGGWLASKLFNVKALACLVVILALGYCQYRFYDWSHTRGYAQGVASQAKPIKDLKDQLASTTAQLTATKSTLDGWVSKYNAYVAASTKQVADLQNAYAQTQATYTKQIAALQNTLANAQLELTNATSTYITSVGNAGCTIPTGFVQLYNLSLQGQAAAPGPTGAASLALAATPLSPYDVPSGLSLSDVARVIVVNNNAAVANRELVLAWQAWWSSVKNDYENYQKTHTTAPQAPSVSLLTPPKDIIRHDPSERPQDPFLAQVQVRRGRSAFMVTH